MAVLPSPESIQTDIDKLKLMRRQCFDAIRAIRGDIKGFAKEKRMLKREVELRPEEYDLEAMQRNIENCDKNAKLFEGTIKKEQSKAAQLDRILKDLEGRKCQSEMMSQSSGVLVPEK